MTEPKDESNSENFINRPPGWEPMYGSFDRPVYEPSDNHRFNQMIKALSKVKQITDFNIKIPESGTNEEHISVHAYTITSETGQKLVLDIHISNFKEWTPEPKGGYNYPEEALVSNGPYYMRLADNLQSIFKLSASKYSLIEYNEEEDIAIYSRESSFPRIPV